MTYASDRRILEEVKEPNKDELHLIAWEFVVWISLRMVHEASLPRKQGNKFKHLGDVCNSDTKCMSRTYLKTIFKYR